jgi:hypothetical protein
LGIIDTVTDAAKSAVSQTSQVVSNAAAQVGDAIESAGQSISERFSDESEPESEAEPEPQSDVEQEQDQDQLQQQEIETETGGIDPNEDADSVRNVDTSDIEYLTAKQEYSFRLTPNLSPNEYLGQQRSAALAEWVTPNLIDNPMVPDDFETLQLAVRYEVIQDGEIFDTSRMRSEQVSMEAPESAAQSLRNNVRGLARRDESDYDAINIFSEHIVISATS